MHTVRYFSSSLFLALACLVLASDASASIVPATIESGLSQDEEQKLVLTRLNGPIKLDGIGNDDAWSSVVPVDVTMYQPTYEGALTERTEIRIGYDSEYLYVLAQLYDSEPSGIMSSTMYRDGGSFADDYLNVVIDPFNDNENALWFYTTPAGIRGDAALSNDAINFQSMNSSWDGFWDVEVRTTDEGWFAEMRIPFTTLGFQSSQESTVMGIAISRVISRKNERHVFPSIPPNWNLGFAKPSLMQDVELQQVRGKKAVYVTPYARSGLERTPSLNADQTRFRSQNDASQDLGLDIRYNLTGNLIADLTVNTDFAQAEADDQQINLGRFSLFFPEKRQFFQERAGLFDYSLGFQDRMFHSRQIGLTNGEPTRVFGGGRLVGRVQNWDVGIMSLQTEAGGNFSSENFTVLRTRKRVLNDNSWAGGMLTSRIGEDGTYNVALGLDGVVRVVGDEYLTVRVAQTSDDKRTSTVGSGFDKNGFVQVQWQRRRELGFNYMVWLTRWEEDFVPRAGFFRLTDFTQTLGRFAYNWLPGENSRWRTIETAFFGNINFANRDGDLETAIWGNSTALETKRGAEVELEILGNHERLTEELFFPDGARVGVGEHTYWSTNLAVRSAQGRRFRVGGSVGAGQFFDGNNFNIDFFPSWNASKHFELGAAYIFNRVRFSDRDQGFDAHIARVKVAVAANSKLSASSFVQYNSAADMVAMNVRFRYNFSERNDLWIVFNDGLNTERRAFSPVLPVSAGRVLLLKYTYTFTV